MLLLDIPVLGNGTLGDITVVANLGGPGVFGPAMLDGRQTLVIVSDNNFSAGQFTQFIVLAADIQATS